MKYQLVVFDWEGTLGDILGPTLSTIKQEAEILHLPPIDEDLARSSLRFGLSYALKQLYPTIPLERSQILLSKVQYTLATQPALVSLIPGAHLFLEALKAANIPMAIASNKGQASLERCLLQTGLTDFFKIIRTSTHAPAKPHPQMLEDILAFMHIDAAHTLMIGDSNSDMEMAQSLNVDAVGVNFYQDEMQAQELVSAGALLVFNDYEALAQFFWKAHE